MTVIQTQLRQGNTWMTTWLPRDKRVKEGSIISLEKVEGRWEVVKQMSSMELSDIKRGWNNNY